MAAMGGIGSKEKPPIQIIGRVAELSPEARALVDEEASIAGAVDKLAASGLSVDAIRLLAYSMSIRDLAWWGTLACWHAQRKKRTPQEMALLNVVLLWTISPTAQAVAELRRQSAALPLDRDVCQLARMVIAADDAPAGVSARKAGACSLFQVSAQRGHRTRDEFYADLVSIGQAIAAAPEHWLSKR